MYRAAHHRHHPLTVIHTSTNLPADDLVNVGPIPATGVARTFLGLAALVPELSEEAISTAIGVAARDGLVSDPWLWWRLEMLRCRGRNGVRTMEEILRKRQRLGPTESWLEQRFMELLEEHGHTPSRSPPFWVPNLAPTTRFRPKNGSARHRPPPPTVLGTQPGTDRHHRYQERPGLARVARHLARVSPPPARVGPRARAHPSPGAPPPGPREPTARPLAVPGRR